MVNWRDVVRARLRARVLFLGAARLLANGASRDRLVEYHADSLKILAKPFAVREDGRG